MGGLLASRTRVIEHGEDTAAGGLRQSSWLVPDGCDVDCGGNAVGSTAGTHAVPSAHMRLQSVSSDGKRLGLPSGWEGAFLPMMGSASLGPLSEGRPLPSVSLHFDPGVSCSYR